MPGAAPAAAPPPRPPFDALLVDATGEHARALGATLAQVGAVPPTVRVLGPGLWGGQAARLGALAGAWFAAPNPADRGGFAQLYSSRYGSQPPALADLAFDAASIARVLGGQGPITAAALTQSEGFGGVDGFFALLPDGHVRRGLAVFEIAPAGGARLVSPAPTNARGAGV